MADDQRIAILEQHVRKLYEQIGALRAELRTGAPESVPHVEEAPPVFASAEPPAAPPRPPPPPARAPDFAARQSPDIDFEKLVGRYGTIAVASLAILMGVGTFLSWAIERGLLGPTVRVVLGFIGAAIVALVGVWVREKRDVRFGNVLLALALAIVHVDSWAAGPYLQVISTVAALSIAALASAALAALALTSAERTLFAIGFAGAMLAPFVTAREPGSVVLLLTYGWVVIALSLFAIRERGWVPILWLMVAGALVYVVAAAAGPHITDDRWAATHAPVLFAFACTAAGLLFARDTLRSKLALAFLIVACIATLGYSIHAQRLELAVSLVGTIASYLIARELETDAGWLMIGNVVVPLFLLLATVVSAADNTIRALAGAGLAVVASLLAWEGEDERAGHLFVACIASGIAIVTYLAEYDTRCIAALALHAALFTLFFRSTRAKLLLPPVILELTILTAWTFLLLDSRPAYAFTPFATLPSLLALAAVSAWAWLGYALKTALPTENVEVDALPGIVSALAMAIAFFWIRQELAHAWSADTASFALIIYYAVAGLALIFAGRLRAEGLLRGVGLGLAFLAGFDAIVETSEIGSVGLRVGARILVGAFLAAVAYWYRTPSEPSAGTDDTAAPSSGDPLTANSAGAAGL
ncbi:MAG TPA: DUF2339 domain-containing protein [Gemmatimonadaceae bacterium]